MFENWKIDNKQVIPPLESDRLTIDLTFDKGTIAESQPVLSFNKMVLANESKEAYLCAIKKNGPYQQVPVNFDLNGREIFNGYLTDANFLGEIDQIEVKPVSNSSTDGLTEKLSAIESSLLKDLYNYRDLDYIIEKTDITSELAQLSLSILTYTYILYNQIKEAQLLVAKGVEAFTPTGVPPVPDFGKIVRYLIEVALQAVFLTTTIVQLISYAKELKELLIPKKRKTKVISLYELCKTPFEYIGYSFVTDIPEMSEDFHWASGQVDNGEYHPRTVDVCGSALGAVNFVLKKYSARVFVRGNTVFITKYYSPLFFKGSSLALQSFPDGNYKENIDDMVGTREHLYEVDYNDDWTLKNFKGTEYKVRANISDPTKSMIKGLKQRIYGVGLVNRKDSLNQLEKLWESFASLVIEVVELFGGSSLGLTLETRLGVAKISNDRLGVAKILRLSGRKIPANHRELLSAKADEENFHWIESHVRNPRAKKRIYEDVLQIFDEKSLSCVIDSNLVTHVNGVVGEMSSVSWESKADNAILNFELEDIERDTKLIETFYEPIK